MKSFSVCTPPTDSVVEGIHGAEPSEEEEAAARRQNGRRSAVCSPIPASACVDTQLPWPSARFGCREPADRASLPPPV